MPPPAKAGRATKVIPSVDPNAALYITMSAPVQTVALLFVLTEGLDGWSTETSVVAWEQYDDGAWRTLQLIGDSTNGLNNSGIVKLDLLERQDTETAPYLRVRLVSGMNNVPLVSAVLANAVAATWIGPGGVSNLGTPLPAGTITQSVTTLADIGTISQPMQSTGGHPPAVGSPFHMWMAERLRHKGFAIDNWDYAALVLAAVPALWQVAVIPATNATTGEAAPGCVWLVAVAGPATPNIADPTVPSADPSVLSEIGEMLEPLISPFIQLVVTNPPYRRLTVVATLVFSDTDTSDAWKQRLQTELIKWLSPWPDPALGPRPSNYYSVHAVKEFVSHREYVLGVLSLEVVSLDKDMSPGREAPGWVYFTSAVKHDLTCPPQAAPVAARRPGTRVPNAPAKAGA